MNLITVSEISSSQISEIFSIADRFRKGKVIKKNLNKKFVLFFERPSTRTRISFESAIAELGGYPIYVDAETTQKSRGETTQDTAKVLSLYSDFIIARLKSHQDMVEMAKFSSIPLINALTDMEHPCQAISDLYTIKQMKGRLKGIRFVFVGDIATNTANSLMVAGAKMGLSIVLLGPKEVRPNRYYLDLAREYSDVSVERDITKGVKGADILYTDSFVSMGEEAETEKRIRRFSSYQINSAMLKNASSDVMVMHCLPAHRGVEITSDVMDGKKSIIWEQAKNKLVVEKAIIKYISKS